MALKTPILRNGLTDYAPWTGPTREHPRPNLIVSQRRRAKHDVRAMLRDARRRSSYALLVPRPDDSWSLPRLREKAAALGVPFTTKTRKADLLARVTDAL